MKNLCEKLIGKTVIARSVEAGVYYGTLVAVEGEAVELKDARNIWSWSGATCLAQVAEEGIKGGRVSRRVSNIVLTKACQILLLSEAAQENLDKQKDWRA